MARDRRDIRRPGEKKSSWAFPFFLILLAIGAFFFGFETFNPLEKEDEKYLSLIEESNLLKKEINSLKQNIDTKNDDLDFYKGYVGKLEQDIVYLKSEIKELSKETKSYEDKKRSEPEVKIIASDDRSGPKLVIPPADKSKKEKLIRGPKVIYPRRALDRGIAGEVTLLFDISREGEPYNIRVSYSSNSIFNQSARKAVEKMLYEPALDKRGRTIPSRDLKQTIRFRLED